MESVSIYQLRVGNLVIHPNRFGEGDYVTKVQELSVSRGIRIGHNLQSSTWSNVKPIKLTLDWVLKLGFEKCIDTERGGMDVYDYEGFMLWDNEDGKFYHINDESVTHFDTVHHLQNYYFFMTLIDGKGEELEVKNDG